MSLFRKQGRELTEAEQRELTEGPEPTRADRMRSKAQAVASAKLDELMADVLKRIETAAANGSTNLVVTLDHLSKGSSMLLGLHERLRAEGFKVDWKYTVSHYSDTLVSWEEPS